MPNCENCTGKCPQAEMASEIAKGRMYAMDELCRLVSDMESGKLVKVRHGKWVAGRKIGREFVGSRTESVLYDEWGCNCCGLAIRTPYKPIYKYCPNCGAKMDGGGE